MKVAGWLVALLLTVGYVATYCGGAADRKVIRRLSARADSLASVVEALRADSGALKAAQETVIVRQRVTDRVLVSMPAPVVPDADSLACFNLVAFDAWRDSLQAALDDERAAWRGERFVLLGQIARRDTLLLAYQATLDSTLSVAKRRVRIDWKLPVVAFLAGVVVWEFAR